MDVDAVVAVADDEAAEALVAKLRLAGYEVAYEIEQTERSRFAGVRLYPPEMSGRGLLVDILFANCGIEREIVAAAEHQRVVGSLQMPVVALGHLIAMKVLAEGERRQKDVFDLEGLIPVASDVEIERARAAVRLMQERGFAGSKDLAANLESFISRFRRP